MKINLFQLMLGTITAALCLLCLSGCGQTGPLYLPPPDNVEYHG